MLTNTFLQGTLSPVSPLAYGIKICVRAYGIQCLRECLRFARRDLRAFLDLVFLDLLDLLDCLLCLDFLLFINRLFFVVPPPNSGTSLIIVISPSRAMEHKSAIGNGVSASPHA
jgi:hypothetical protein